MLLSHLPAAAEIPTNVFDPLVETFDFKQSSVGLYELEKQRYMQFLKGLSPSYKNIYLLIYIDFLDPVK